MNLEEVLYIKCALINNSLNVNMINFGKDKNEFLKGLNCFVKKNIGFFCLYEYTLNNYKNLLNLFDNDKSLYVKEIIKGFTNILDIESIDDSLKEKYVLEYLNKEKNNRHLDYIPDKEELCEMINYDFVIYQTLVNGNLFYRGKKSEKYIKSSLNYFMSIDCENKELYDFFVDAYKQVGYVYESEKCKILKFPKRSLFRWLLKK